SNFSVGRSHPISRASPERSGWYRRKGYRPTATIVGTSCWPSYQKLAETPVSRFGEAARGHCAAFDMCDIKEQ
ncbi:MAG TPA: hypothetical protein VFH89_15120, partial [Sphingomicrobium sp.]|nr:hypothetical protein [Sphingomicrobium sp.]